MADPFDSLRMIDRERAIELSGLSRRTWDRLEAAGKGPTKTKLSERRIGYRFDHFKAWLDARAVIDGENLPNSNHRAPRANRED